MADCEWCKDEICVNADCPMCCDYCPVPDTDGVCRFENRSEIGAKTMAEYIERKRAIVDACNSLELYPSEYAKLEDALNKIPAADVAPVRRGRWVLVDSDVEQFFMCNKCNEKEYWESDYCPNCGCRMDGGN